MAEPDTLFQIIKAWNYINERFDEIREILTKNKTRRLKLLGSKDSEIVEKKIREALEGTKHIIECAVWYGKSFAIQSGCGTEVDVQFHQLMGLIVEKFNNVSLRLIPEKIDDRFRGYLEGQLEILQESAHHFWDIQQIGKNDTEKKVSEIIQIFRTQLFDFERNMEPYIKETALQKAVKERLK